MRDYPPPGMRLIVIRHAEASPGDPDELRPLTPKGREQARALAGELRDRGIDADAVVTSPLLRALETAAALEQGEPAIDDRLAPGATPADVREAAADRGDTVIVVGHQPDCGEAVLAFAGREVSFAPAGYHEVEL